MVFSSVTFLFYFLPAFLLVYFAFRSTRARNLVLLVFSLVFYAWGGLGNLIVLGFSIVLNFLFARLIDRCTGRARDRALALTVASNLAGLVAFKYSGFLAENLNVLLDPLGASLPVVNPRLPLGISFFTFHAISYLVDVYRGRARANPRLEEIALYITMFPQLVAGPIVRYAGIAPRIHHRRVTLGRVSAGLRIFVIGLSWKVLIADQVAPIVNLAFDGSAPDLSMAWLGLVAYALQIYFDFAGYSNMAIGIALAIGLKFPRNFRLPYGAISVTDFWRRWHISLSNWFRDYVYVPLGGNRRGPWRTAVNLWVVFLLCGLWHGASWTFVIWGAHHGFFLVLERTAFGRWIAAGPRVLAHAYTLLAVLGGWVWFRADSLERAGNYFAGLAGWNGAGALPVAVVLALQPLPVAALIVGIPLSIWGPPRWPADMAVHRLRSAAGAAADTAMMTVLFLLSIVMVGAAAYSSFLYFRF